MHVNLILAKKNYIFDHFTKIVFGLGFVGLIFSAGSLDSGYEVGKTVWLQWWVRILMVGLWAKVMLDPHGVELKFFSKKINIALAILLSIVFLTAILGVNWQQSLWGNYYRGDGLITWTHLIILTFLSGWLLMKREVITLLPFVANVAGIILLIKIIFPSFLNWSAIGFGNSNIDAGFLVVIAPLVMFSLKKLHWVFVGVSFLAILATTIHLQAWGAVMSLGLFLIMSWWLKKYRRRKWVIILPGIFLMVGFIGVIGWQPTNNSNFTESRSRLVNKLVRAGLKRPVLGWGWSNIDQAFESVDWPVAVNHDIYVDKAHSELSEIMVVSGLLGLGSYLLFLGFSYQEIVNSDRLKNDWGQTLFLVCLVYFFHSQTNIVSVSESAVFWISLGLLLD